MAGGTETKGVKPEAGGKLEAEIWVKREVLGRGADLRVTWLQNELEEPGDLE